MVHSSTLGAGGLSEVLSSEAGEVAGPVFISLLGLAS
jgi:hypothetical protein